MHMQTSVGISSQVYADIDHPVTILRGEYFMVNVELESWFENETQANNILAFSSYLVYFF